MAYYDQIYVGAPRLNSGNAIITAAMLPPGDTNTNIAFGSIMRRPDWLVTGPLAGYTYLNYFSAHNGLFIRVAYSNSLTSGWTVYDPHTNLTLAALEAWGGWSHVAGGHIASPSARNDQANSRIILTGHALAGAPFGHESFTSESTTDGINFNFLHGPIGGLYMRPVLINGVWYATEENGYFLKSNDPDGLDDYVSPSDIEIFRASILGTGSPQAIPRHLGNDLRPGNLLDVLLSRFNELERIQMATVDVSGADWNTWALSTLVDNVQWPVTVDEGGLEPQVISAGGQINGPVYQLRDPQIFVDSDGQKYLQYNGAGENCLMIAKFTTQPGVYTQGTQTVQKQMPWLP